MNETKVLILGSTGFLGSYLYEKFKNSKNYFIETSSRDDFKLIHEKVEISEVLQQKIKNSNVIINCIAETDFKKCIMHGDFANVKIPEALNQFIKKKYFIHISTDAFYESRNNSSSETAPLTFNNLYSKQKFKAESILRSNDVLIIRTSFVGKNSRGTGLLNYIESALQNEKLIQGWDDVYTSSVHVSHLVSLISKLISNRLTGTYNYGTKEAYSKYSYLKAIMDGLGNKKRLLSRVNCPLSDIKRNQKCGLNSELLSKDLAIELPNFDDVVIRSVKQLINE